MKEGVDFIVEYDDDENAELKEINEDEEDENNDEDDEEANSDMDTFNHSYKNFERPSYVVNIYEKHEAEVVSLSTDPSNRRNFVSGGMDDKMILWSLDSEEPQQVIAFTETVAFVSYGFDGNYLAVACLDNTISVLEKEQDGSFKLKHKLADSFDEITVK